LASYYIETSALVKLYVREAGTDNMLRLAQTCGPRKMTVLALSRVEFRAALRRRERAGDIEAGIGHALRSRFDSHWEEQFLIQSVTEMVLADAVLLIDKHPLRAYDAVQLAGCLVFCSRTGPEPVVFVSADRDLLAAAEIEGVTVLDPSR